MKELLVGVFMEAYYQSRLHAPYRGGWGGGRRNRVQVLRWREELARRQCIKEAARRANAIPMRICHAANKYMNDLPSCGHGYDFILKGKIEICYACYYNDVKRNDLIARVAKRDMLSGGEL